MSIQPNVFSDTEKHHFHTNEIEVILSLQFNFHPTSTTVSKDIFANLFSKNKSLENLTKFDADKRGKNTDLPPSKMKECKK